MAALYFFEEAPGAAPAAGDSSAHALHASTSFGRLSMGAWYFVVAVHSGARYDVPVPQATERSQVHVVSCEGKAGRLAEG